MKIPTATQEQRDLIAQCDRRLPGWDRRAAARLTNDRRETAAPSTLKESA